MLLRTSLKFQESIPKREWRYDEGPLAGSHGVWAGVPLPRRELECRGARSARQAVRLLAEVLAATHDGY